MHLQFWLDYPKGKEHLKDMDIEGRINSGIKSDLKFIEYEAFGLI